MDPITLSSLASQKNEEEKEMVFKNYIPYSKPLLEKRADTNELTFASKIEALYERKVKKAVEKQKKREANTLSLVPKEPTQDLKRLMK